MYLTKEGLSQAYDGKVGWSIDPVSGPALVVGRALTERADESWFDAPLHVENFVRQATMVGREDFDRRAAYRIKLVLASGLEQEELFEVETGLQIGLEARRETPFGSAVQEGASIGHLLPVGPMLQEELRDHRMPFGGRIVQASGDACCRCFVRKTRRMSLAEDATAGAGESSTKRTILQRPKACVSSRASLPRIRTR